MTEEKLLLLTINFQDIENMVKMNQMSQKNCIFDIIVVGIFLPDLHTRQINHF